MSFVLKWLIFYTAFGLFFAVLIFYIDMAIRGESAGTMKEFANILVTTCLTFYVLGFFFHLIGYAP